MKQYAKVKDIERLLTSGEKKRLHDAEYMENKQRGWKSPFVKYADFRAIDYLKGPLHAFTDIVDVAKAYIKERGEIKEYDLTRYLLAKGYDHAHIQRAHKEYLQLSANIGFVRWVYIWYEPEAGDEAKQEAIDNF